MDKLVKIRSSLVDIDSISKEYIKNCGDQVTIKKNYIGDELDKRMAELEERFKNSILPYCKNIIENIELFKEADSKEVPIDVNDTSLFNVGNLLASNGEIEMGLVLRLVRPFASNKSAISFLKGVAKDIYKPTVEMFETPKEYLDTCESHMKNIIDNPFSCIGLLSDVRTKINLYAISNGYEIEDVPSDEFTQLKMNRIASMMGLEVN